jgi:hypothetical protein
MKIVMKRLVLVLVAFGAVVTGCTGHYYIVKADSVDLYLKKPGAEVVYFFSSLDGYRPHRAEKVDAQTWKVTVPANTEFKYFYRVDGHEYLPSCKLRENDDFGGQVCIYSPGL